MNEQKKFGWTEKGIIGMIFSPLGLFFAVLGVLLWYFKAGEDPEDPMIFLCVFGGMGLVFLLIGLGMLMADVNRRNHMRHLHDAGECVMAQIVGVQARTNVNAGRTHPFVVECHYKDPDTGVTHIYFSRYLYFNPTDLLTSDQVPVYRDRSDGKYAFVDIDAVLPPVELHMV